MADELWNTLMKFHSEVAEPRIVGPILERIEASDRNARGNFDALWKAFERLDIEYQALSAAVRRLEEQMLNVDQKLDRMVVRSELLELKARVALLEEKIAELENEI